jgi:DNA-directed RNA polymerase specialized sigma24 family protein
VKLSSKHQTAAILVAADELTDEEIASQVEVHRSTLALWKQQADFRALVSIQRAAVRKQSVSTGISRRNRRTAKTTIRGVRLQMAIKLVAEQSLTDDEIAMRLRVRLGTLEELKRDPLFAKRVDDTRDGLPDTTNLLRAGIDAWTAIKYTGRV